MVAERKNPITSEKVIGFNRVWRPSDDGIVYGEIALNIGNI